VRASSAGVVKTANLPKIPSPTSLGLPKTPDLAKMVSLTLRGAKTANLPKMHPTLCASPAWMSSPQAGPVLERSVY